MKLLLRYLAAAWLASCAAFAWAQPHVADAERCLSITSNPDLAIQYCTRAIDSGRITGTDLARLHFSRGVEWASKMDYDRAIADYDAALRLSPAYADAYFNRGNAWANKGEPDRAIADYDAAIKLNPKDIAPVIGRAVELALQGDYLRAISDYESVLRTNPRSEDAHFGRGRARFYSDEFRGAIADLEEALKLEPNAYTPIWLYFARKRAGAPSPEEALDNETRQARGGGWPAALIVFLLGRTDMNSVHAAAADPDPRILRENRCEVNFYLAHWHLLRDERDRALTLLREAAASCPKNIIEYEGTLAELRRLQR